MNSWRACAGLWMIFSVGCGSRTGLLTRDVWDTDSAEDGGLGDDVHDSAMRDVVTDAAREPTRCEYGPLSQITDVRSGASLRSATRGPDGKVWVLWDESLAEPQEYPEHMLSEVEEGGSVLWQKPVLARPAVLTGFIGSPEVVYSAGLRQAAILDWDSVQNCRMRFLAPDGTALGMPFDPLQASGSFPLEHCRSLREAEGLWDFLGAELRALEGVGLMRRGPDGSFVHAVEVIETIAREGSLARASLDDQSFVLAVSFPAWTTVPDLIGRYAADGRELVPARPFFEPPGAPTRTRLVSYQGKVVALWVEDEATGTAHAHLRVLSPDLETLVPAREIIPTPMVPRSLTMAAGDGVLVAYGLVGQGGAPNLAIARFSGDGTEELRERVPVGLRALGSLAIVPTNGQWLLVFEGIPEGGRGQQVYALRARCPR